MDKLVLYELKQAIRVLKEEQQIIEMAASNDDDVLLLHSFRNVISYLTDISE